MNATHLWTRFWVGDPQALWKRRLVLGLLECALLLVLQFNRDTGFGQLLLLILMPFTMGAPARFLSIQFSYMIARWWVATAVFLPLALVVVSSIATRQCIARKSPIPLSTKIAAKAGGLIPFISGTAMMLLVIFQYGFPYSYGGTRLPLGVPYSYGGNTLPLGALAALICSLYYAWITFEGRWFRALDFRGTGNTSISGNLEETAVEQGIKAIDWAAMSREGRAPQDPRTLWTWRLALSLLECILFLGIPITVGWGPGSSILINSAFYSYEFKEIWFHGFFCSPGTGSGFQIGGYFSYIIWATWWGLWWVATAIFLPVVLGVISSITTRRNITTRSPIPWGARIAAKVAVALPLLNCLGLFVYWSLSFIIPFDYPYSPHSCYYASEVSLFVAPVLVFACALFHAWITFEGRGFRASDFRVSRSVHSFSLNQAPFRAQPRRQPATFDRGGKLPSLDRRAKFSPSGC